MNDELKTARLTAHRSYFIVHSSHDPALAEAFELRVGEALRARVEQELGGRRADERADAREREEPAVRRRPELRARLDRVFAEASARAVVAGHGLPEVVAPVGRDRLV